MKKTDFFARMTLWTPHLKLTTEGHVIGVLSQVFEYLMTEQKHALISRLLSQTPPTSTDELKRQMMRHFQGSQHLHAHMKSLFLVDAVDSAGANWGQTDTQIVNALTTAIHKPAVEVALRVLGINALSDSELNDEHLGIIASEVGVVKQWIKSNTQ